MIEAIHVMRSTNKRVHQPGWAIRNQVSRCPANILACNAPQAQTGALTGPFFMIRLFCRNGTARHFASTNVLSCGNQVAHIVVRLSCAYPSQLFERLTWTNSPARLSDSSSDSSPCRCASCSLVRSRDENES